MTTIIVIAAFVLSIIFYLSLGYVYSKRTKFLGDMLPLLPGQQAEVKNVKEFSATTVATSISLATVILFFFEAAPNMGLWLLWCCLTTVVGIFVVKVLAGKIWDRMNQYGHKPSLHEFLGTEFNSKKVAMIGAICTSIGYLGTFGLELYLGSTFLAGLVPGIPVWVTVCIISIVGFSYTAMGGFRIVVVSDRVQMYTIWMMIIGLFVYYSIYIYENGGWQVNFNKVPEQVYNFSWTNNLWSFIVGIFIINICMFLVSMSIWQRIAASPKKQIISKGLWSSIVGTGISWSLLVVAACLVYIVVKPIEGQNPLTTLLTYIGEEGSLAGRIILFFAVVGLFGSQLSTASTQLIATSHTIHLDVLVSAKRTGISEQINTKKELLISRIVLIIVAILAIGTVAILSISGFSIVDLAFALYGGQLALFGPVLYSLTKNRSELKSLSSVATVAVAVGIFVGWAAAVYGKLNAHQDLVFLSPVLSLASSFLILWIGSIVQTKSNLNKP